LTRKHNVDLSPSEIEKEHLQNNSSSFILERTVATGRKSLYVEQVNNFENLFSTRIRYIGILYIHEFHA
jgi:hypothetical protein